MERKNKSPSKIQEWWIATKAIFLNSGYDVAGASHKKGLFKRFNASSKSAHSDIDYNLATLRERARTLDMSATMARAATQNMITHVIGTGLKLQSQIDHEILGITTEEAYELQTQIEREFSLWADSKRSCDANAIDDFYGLQQKALRNALISGDCFAIRTTHRVSQSRPYQLRIQLIEADRCRTPVEGVANRSITTGVAENGNLIFDGVEVDGCEIVAYHFCTHHPGERNFKYDPDEEEWYRIPAYGGRTDLPNVIHVMDAERPEQYRGVPFLAIIFEPILQLRRFTLAELEAAWQQACSSVFIEKERPWEIGLNPLGAGEEDEDEWAEEYKMAPGYVNYMKSGEKVNHVTTTKPSGTFDPFVTAIIKQMGASLGISYEVLLGSFTSSYSASRAALDQSWQTYNMRRRWFIEDFCQPIYEIWLSEAIARGRIKAPGFFSDPLIRKAYCGADWVGPTQGTLDPVKEMTAYEMAEKHGWMTNAEIVKELTGRSFEKNLERLKIEREMLNAIPASASEGQTITYNGKDNGEEVSEQDGSDGENGDSDSEDE